jgi:hypothetical protein
MDLVERGRSGRRHPWETARAAFFLRLLGQHGLYGEAGSWLDAGAGDAWFAAQLRHLVPRDTTIACWDVNYTPDDISDLSQGVTGITFVAERPAQRFDRILLLDVLEHIEDDVTFLTSLVDNVLGEEGVVVMSVPAHQSLFSSHDRMLRHFRRYAPADAARVVERAGLRVVASGGLFLSLLPARAGQVLLERIHEPSQDSTGIGDWSHGRTLTRALEAFLAVDTALSLWLSGRGRATPGLSYWAVCRRAR